MKKFSPRLTMVLVCAVLAASISILPASAAEFTDSPSRVVVDALPDANAANAPAVVTVEGEDGEQTTYVRTENPEEEGDYLYLPEEEVPLANQLLGEPLGASIQNGFGLGWLSRLAIIAAVAVFGGICLYLLLGKRKKDENED